MSSSSVCSRSASVARRLASLSWSSAAIFARLRPTAPSSSRRLRGSGRQRLEPSGRLERFFELPRRLRQVARDPDTRSEREHDRERERTSWSIRRAASVASNAARLACLRRWRPGRGAADGRAHLVGGIFPGDAWHTLPARRRTSARRFAAAYLADPACDGARTSSTSSSSRPGSAAARLGEDADEIARAPLVRREEDSTPVRR